VSSDTALSNVSVVAPPPLAPAIVLGLPFTDLPLDLYIPPDAMQVFLETFEGPLDLLLYLIRRQNLNILDIPITEITHQYLQYINLMQEMELELAAEYLVMAALLLEIKSRMLLPRPQDEDNPTEDDPRERLVQQLQDYAIFKQAAEDLNNLPQVGWDTFLVEVEMPNIPQVKMPPTIPLAEVISAMRDVLVRLELFTTHHIAREPLSVRERMSYVLECLNTQEKLLFQALFTYNEGRQGAVVAFLAILELARESLLEVMQQQAFGQIEVCAKPNHNDTTRQAIS
jgi:segregation and condensation protein A